MSIAEIPLSADNQLFTLQLAGQQLRLRLIYRDVAGWVLDILDPDDLPIVSGIPLVPGVDLLAAYGSLGFSGGLWVVSDDETQEYPSKTNLGYGSHLYFVTTD
ncbi:hypothetical protein MUA04_02165 [Enterobacteriaceae bacterium H11S18]|uniref:phage baseplate plug family protein n=1 Tax=Dryocola clanedunensis TaxID=2925396 RepID=UPI0022F09E69|nr:hypothetical protein [Dryocola clanedunensis]MCT4707339.1 hypothetical protein [Dryocola clanedunensis]MCT4709021.1 hypothetical protein [Dryocola clanedunensis]